MERTFRISLLVATVACVMAQAPALMARSSEELALAASKIPAEAFFIQTEVGHPRLSPDGSKVAYLQIVQGRVALVVYERDTEAILVITPDLEFDVRDFFWKGEDHLVYFSNEK